jgi:hypothetical protein
LKNSEGIVDRFLNDEAVFHYLKRRPIMLWFAPTIYANMPFAPIIIFKRSISSMNTYKSLSFI